MKLNEHEAAPRAIDVRLLDPQVLDVETVQREFKRAGKEIRRWRVLFDAVVREVGHLRRARRADQRRSAERSRNRAAQLKMLGATSVDDLIAKVHARYTADELAAGRKVEAKCELCIERGILPSRAVACYAHSESFIEERVRSPEFGQDLCDAMNEERWRDATHLLIWKVDALYRERRKDLEQL